MGTWTTVSMADLAELIGRRARSARVELGQTQAEIAEGARMTTEAYGRLERGRSMPKLQTLVRLAKVLQVEPGYLIGSAARRNPAEPMSPEVRRIVQLLQTADRSTRKLILAVTRAVTKTAR